MNKVLLQWRKPISHHKQNGKEFSALINSRSSNCQAKVKSRKSQEKVKKKKEKTWLCLLYCHYSTPPPTTTTTTLNFSSTSSGLTTKCYTFLETSHDPWLRSNLKSCSWLLSGMSMSSKTPRRSPLLSRKSPLLFRRSLHLSRSNVKWAFRLTMSTPV